MPATETATEQIAALAIKLPTFFANQPRVWFTQAEAQFALRGVTADETKFHHAVAALDQHTAIRVLDLLEKPPSSDKYETLKKRLIGSFSLSRAEKAKKLLQLPPQPDRKPSEVLDEFLAILGKDYHPDCLFFEELFRSQLAPEAQLQLASLPFTDPRAFAEKADQIWTARVSSAVNAVQTGTSRPKRFSTARPQPSKNPSSTRFSVSTESELCYYHRTFGEKAKKCRPPCSRGALFEISDPGNEEAGCQ